MNNDNSLATTSMMSTTSQFSSPIESTDISADWSKAEKLTFVPLPPNGRISSPSMTESIRLNLAKMPLQSTQQNNYQQPPPLYQQQSPPKFMPQPSAQFNGNSFQNAQIPPQQYYHPGQTGQNYYEHQMPNAEYWPSQNNVQNVHQILPTQSQWMQNILAQNRGNGAAQNANGIGGMRTLWEQRIREENMEKHREELTKSRLSLGPKQFLFPRWRSVDAMTASLVASAKTTQMLPRDSRIPEYRQEKLAQTEQAAQINKFELHKPYIQMAIYKQHQRRGRSLLAEKPPYGAEEMARRRTMALYGVEGDQWYDPGQIRQAVSHESIANVGATRQMWEQTSWAEMAKGEFDREQERRQHFAQQRYWLPQ